MAAVVYKQFLFFFLFLKINSAEKFGSDDRIVGGWPTTVEKYPFVVLIFGPSLCGGSILAEFWVLTAAHCVIPGMDSVLYGKNNLSDRLAGKSIAQVEKPFVLEVPKIDPPSEFDKKIDVALLKLKQAIPFTAKARAIKLPEPQFEIPGNYVEDLIVIGWGRLEQGEDKPPSENLQETVVKAVETSQCEVWKDGEKGKLPKWFLCGGVQDASRDACQGDSGGPAITKNGILVGVISFGKGCAAAGVSGAYMKVSYFIDQIEKVTQLKRGEDGFLK